VLERLRAAAWEIEILSGDHPAVVGAVARRLPSRVPTRKCQ
jgi:cation transport ATPase